MVHFMSMKIDYWRTAQDKQVGKRDFINWAKETGQQAIVLALLLKAMLMGEEPIYPPGLSL